MIAHGTQLSGTEVHTRQPEPNLESAELDLLRELDEEGGFSGRLWLAEMAQPAGDFPWATKK